MFNAFYTVKILTLLCWWKLLWKWSKMMLIFAQNTVVFWSRNWWCLVQRMFNPSDIISQTGFAEFCTGSLDLRTRKVLWSFVRSLWRRQKRSGSKFYSIKTTARSTTKFTNWGRLLPRCALSLVLWVNSRSSLITNWNFWKPKQSESYNSMLLSRASSTPSNVTLHSCSIQIKCLVLMLLKSNLETKNPITSWSQRINMT